MLVQGVSKVVNEVELYESSNSPWSLGPSTRRQTRSSASPLPSSVGGAFTAAPSKPGPLATIAQRS